MPAVAIYKQIEQEKKFVRLFTVSGKQPVRVISSLYLKKYPSEANDELYIAGRRKVGENWVEGPLMLMDKEY